MQPVLALLASHKHKESDMGQYKPMVKMETTEPSVELKLKKGGKVAKKADGGMMGSPMSAAGAMPPPMPARGGMMGAKAPMRPSLAMRRRAMRGRPSGAGPAGPVGGAAQMQPSMPSAMPPMMKKGGKADMGQDKAMIKKAFKQHDMQEHKGGKGTKLALKKGGKMATGGVVNGQGGFATGGVVNGQGGFATGGVAKSNAGGYKSGGKIKKMAEGGDLVSALGGLQPSTGLSVASKPGGGGGGGDAISGLGNVTQGADTIGSALRNISSSVGSGGGQGGPRPSAMMKRGGKATKKAYAAGGTVDSGRPVAMPQGNKKPSQPVRTNLVAGTFKKGGTVKMKHGGDSSDKGEDMTKGAYDKAPKYSRDVEDALNPFGMIKELAGKARDYFMPKKTADSVTKTKESVTVTPAKKRGGMVKC